jgi:hypothetical protein
MNATAPPTEGASSASRRTVLAEPLLRMFTSGAGLVGRSFSIRVSNIGIGTLRVDDVYIDPYRRG